MIEIDANRDGYRISTDRSLLDVERVHHWLSVESYWARGRSLEAVERSIENSLAIGIYEGTEQVGIARVVTDYATFAWLCDVYVATTHRGRGLGKWLVETIVATPILKDLHNFILATNDAHELYRDHGNFAPLASPGKWMER